jgi:hypothetical protein
MLEEINLNSFLILVFDKTVPRFLGLGSYTKKLFELPIHSFCKVFVFPKYFR